MTATATQTDATKGLAGVVAGRTALSTVGKEGAGLTYRGYSIDELAEQATFEEVAYLLVYGELPTVQQLADMQTSIEGAARTACGTANDAGAIAGDGASDGRAADRLFDAGLSGAGGVV